MNHPPHLTSSWSSAFIPFCAYKTKLNFSKGDHVLDGTSFPLCSSFLLTILDGQLCYKLTLNGTSGQGKQNELLLVLDYNEERSIQTSLDQSERASMNTLNFDASVESIQGDAAKIHIGTLSPFVSFGEGIYTMTDVKRMTAKDDFLSMPLAERQCEVELYEDCRTRKLIEHCNCVPWEVPGYQVFL